MSCIIVLGLPRSGTSMVSGVLHHLGVFMGKEDKFTPPDEWNPLGYFENLEITGLLVRASRTATTRELMEAAASRGVFPVHADISHELERRIRAIEASHEIWGFKDPRLLLPFFFEAFTALVKSDIKLIVTTRGLLRVKESIGAKLKKTEKQSFDETVDLAVNHLALRLVDVLGRVPVPVLVVQFDSLIDDPKRKVREIAEFVGVEVTQKAISFPNPAFRRF